MKTPCSVLLASGSPRRKELLRQLDVAFRVTPAGINESIAANETPRDYVQRMAHEKAVAGFHQGGGALPSMGADTIVLLEDEILGKPVSRAQAEAMLHRLSGRKHEVYSAVALVLAADNILQTLNITTVAFGNMPDAWIRSYCSSDEPMDKAGAYAVQGGAGQYIRYIEGSYSGVMGLPLYETAQMLRKAGLLQ